MTTIHRVFNFSAGPAVMMGYVYYCARRYGMGRDQAFRWRTLGTTFLAAFPALLTPAIIVGGMTFGWFTPTEAAIAACAWAMVLGIFLYRTLSPKQFYKVSMDTIETTAGVLLIVGAASLFGWVLTTTRVTEYTTEALLALTNNRYVILLLTNVLLLVVGCFLEPIASISILVPVLMPVIVKVGIDPVHFGVMTTHILEVAERMADRIGVIAGGRLIAEGTLEDLRRQTGRTATSLEDTFLALVAEQVAAA